MQRARLSEHRKTTRAGHRGWGGGCGYSVGRWGEGQGIVGQPTAAADLGPCGSSGQAQQHSVAGNSSGAHRLEMRERLLDGIQCLVRWHASIIKGWCWQGWAMKGSPGGGGQSARSSQRKEGGLVGATGGWGRCNWVHRHYCAQARNERIGAGRENWLPRGAGGCHSAAAAPKGGRNKRGVQCAGSAAGEAAAGGVLPYRSWLVWAGVVSWLHNALRLRPEGGGLGVGKRNLLGLQAEEGRAGERLV